MHSVTPQTLHCNQHEELHVYSGLQQTFNMHKKNLNNTKPLMTQEASLYFIGGAGTTFFVSMTGVRLTNSGQDV